MKRIHAIPAAALVAGTSVVAVAQSMSDPSDYLRARDIVDNAIYTTHMAATTGGMSGNSESVVAKTEDVARDAANDARWNVQAMVDDIDSTYNRIGEIEDILLDDDGQVVGVVAEIGGFLDIADKHVMIRMDELKIVQSGDEPYFVTNMSEEQLEDREGLDEGWWS